MISSRINSGQRNRLSWSSPKRWFRGAAGGCCNNADTTMKKDASLFETDEELPMNTDASLPRFLQRKAQAGLGEISTNGVSRPSLGEL
ncbi:unnamed protein product [Caretta caretta]